MLLPFSELQWPETQLLNRKRNIIVLLTPVKRGLLSYPFSRKLKFLRYDKIGVLKIFRLSKFERFSKKYVAAYFLFSLRAKKASNGHLCILIQCHSRLSHFIIKLARMKIGNRLISISYFP